jgi:hypothetical protein
MGCSMGDGWGYGSTSGVDPCWSSGLRLRNALSTNRDPSPLVFYMMGGMES